MEENELRGRIANLLSVLFTCLGLALLSGCAGPVRTALTLEPGEGAIALKIQADSAERNSKIWIASSYVELERVEPAESDSNLDPQVRERNIKRLHYSGKLRTTRSTYVYGSILKAGRYRVRSVTGWISANVTWSIPLRGLLDTIEVRDGEVVHLGTLLIRSLNEVTSDDNGRSGRAVSFGYVPPDADLRESFRRHFPLVAAQVEGRPLRAIELTPELNGATQRALQFKRDRAFALNGLWQDEKGNFFAGSRPGKVLLKKAGQSNWLEVDVGSWDEVTTVRPYQNGLVAGGEDGLLRYSADAGRTWRPLAPPIWGHVEHLEVLPDGKLLSLIRRGPVWSAYVTDDVLVGAWRKLGDMVSAEQAKLIRGSSAETLYYGYPPTVVLHGDNLILTERGSTSLVSMNTQTGSVELLAPPPIGMLHGMTVLPGGLLVLNGEVLKNATFISADGARTWTEVKTRGLLAFKDERVGYSLYGPDFAITRDGGKTWVYPRKSATWTVEQLRYFVIDRSDGALVAVLFNGAVLRSSDEGASWVREH